MDWLVFMAVMLAAAFHAGWNAVVKTGLEQLLTMTLIFFSSGLLAMLALPFVPAPHGATWLWLLASFVFHTGYKLFLLKAYQTGEMGQVYPLARGTAPFIVSMAMFLGPGESLSPTAFGGIMLLVSGILLMSFRGGSHRAPLNKSAVGYALATAVFIASYTITDGLGARSSGSAHGYAAWLFLFDALGMFIILMALRGPAALKLLAPHWKQGLAGGMMAFSAYWLVLWAMTEAPIALVAALRESSVLFGSVLSVWLLKESFTRWRAVATMVILMGIVIAKTG